MILDNPFLTCKIKNPMVNKQYSDLVFKQHLLTNKKHRDAADEEEVKKNGKELTRTELEMSSVDIIESIRDAFKHIPPRD